MFRRRKIEGFNLAFLDIMSCGLGAVVLLFLIIKHNTDAGSVETEALQTQLESLQQQEQQLKTDIDVVKKDADEEKKAGAEAAQQRSGIEKTLEELDDKTAKQEIENQHLRTSIERTQIKQPTDAVTIESAGEEQYLIGLKVEGERVAILIDHSASMSDEKLIDVISRKVRRNSEKRRGPKWLRAKRIVRWLTARLPTQSKLAVVAFNRDAENLGPTPWMNSRDSDALNKMLGELDLLIPTDATNLQAGLQKLDQLKPSPTDVYLITDGLPTVGSSNYGGRVAGCPSASAKSGNISGACRVRLFNNSVNVANASGNIKINVVLLPLEGDPQAAFEYWQWSAKSGGLLITPATGWP